MLADHKPRTTEVELSAKEVREACKKPMIQTKIKLHSKWAAPIKYKVLQVFQLKKEDRKEVFKILAVAITPAKAKLAVHAKAFWSYRDISLTKDFDCGVLMFKGLAVCLFYKRQCTEVEPIATDPVPIGALENEDDIYARLDLFSKSPRELHQSVREEFLELNMQITELGYDIKARDLEITQLEKLARRDAEAIRCMKEHISMLETKLKKAIQLKPKGKSKDVKVKSKRR